MFEPSGNRPALGDLVQDLDVAPYDPNQEARGGYQYHLERFETYDEALTSLRAALDDPLPDWLIGVRGALDDAASEASGAARKLNPRLALEVSLSGRVHISKRESLLGGNTQQGRLGYTYALINESTGESSSAARPAASASATCSTPGTRRPSAAPRSNTRWTARSFVS